MYINSKDSSNKINNKIPEILKSFRQVAVVGISDKPHRPSHYVSEYLLHAGFTIFPVNPRYEEVLGLKCYPTLSDIPHPVEIVDIFRRPDTVMPVVEEAIKIGAKVVWMQQGVINHEAAQKALDAGLLVVMDRCLKIEHSIHSF